MLPSSRAKMRELAPCHGVQAVKVSASSCSAGARDAAARVSVTYVYASRLFSSDKDRDPDPDHDLILTRLTWSAQGVYLDVLRDGDAFAGPLLLGKKKGGTSLGAGVFVRWDLSSASRFGSGPEPVGGGCHVVVEVDGEVALQLGDAGGPGRADFSLVGRVEKAVGDSPRLSTKARFREEGREHHLSLGWSRAEAEGEESELWACVDGRRVVHVRRLRWNFRGNQTIFVEGVPVDVMWDVHDWCEDVAGGGAAMFLFRTRGGLESRLWPAEELLRKERGGRDGFSLLLQACRPSASVHGNRDRARRAGLF